MTDQQHPITPPPELVRQWRDEWIAQSITNKSWVCDHVGTQAARWGAEMELEACIKYFFEYDSSWGENSELITGLRTHRRFKPKSLAEEALLAIDTAVADDRLSPAVAHAVRRALERLQELEGQGQLAKESD